MSKKKNPKKKNLGKKEVIHEKNSIIIYICQLVKCKIAKCVLNRYFNKFLKDLNRVSQLCNTNFVHSRMILRDVIDSFENQMKY